MAEILLINPGKRTAKKRNPKTKTVYVYKRSTGRMYLDRYHGKAIVTEFSEGVVSSHRTIKAAEKEADRLNRRAGHDARFHAYAFEKKLQDKKTGNPCRTSAPKKKRPAARKNADRRILLPPTKRALDMIFAELADRYMGTVFLLASNGKWQVIRKNASLKTARAAARRFSQAAGVSIHDVQILKFKSFGNDYEPRVVNMETDTGILRILPGEIWDQFLDTQAKKRRR